MSDNFKTETRYFEPCRSVENIKDFRRYGMAMDSDIPSCDSCWICNTCDKKGKPIRATIRYQIEVEK